MRTIPLSFSFVFGFILTVFGAGFSAAGLWELYISYQLRSQGSKAQGIVTQIERISNTEADYTSYTISFQIDSADYTAHDHFHLPDTLYKVGDRVEVLYLRDDIETARFNTSRELYGTFVFGLGMGILVLLAGILLMIYRQRVNSFLDRNTT